MLEIEKIEKVLTKLKFNIERNSNLGIDVLCVKSGISGEKIDSEIIITPYPLDEDDFQTNYIQFYFEKRINKDLYKNYDLKSRILEINKELAYGSLNIDEEKIFYKYVLITKKNKIQKIVIIDILNTISYIMDEIMNKFNPNFN